MKKIGLITRDCAGMNACIRSVVRSACVCDIEVVGFLKGYQGLMDGEFVELNRRSVSGIINLGGTILKTARAPEFRKQAGQEKAIKIIKDNNIDGLIIVGGNGSLTAANILHGKYNIPIIGIPATIDNDINGIDLSIGADTAVNVALDALDKIRDTATSMERVFVIEVMGRDCGYIAMQVALAGGCEDVLVPEQDFGIDKICKEISSGNAKGKISWMIIVAEGKARAVDIADCITKNTGLETRVVVFGHVQRGGRPTAIDRIMAARLGNFAVELIKKGEKGKYVGLRNGELFTLALEEVTKPKHIEIDEYYRLIRILT